MKFSSSLDAKDRRLLLWCLGIAIALAVALGFLVPNGNGNDNPLPSTYLAGQHGARAALKRCCARTIRSSDGSGRSANWPTRQGPIQL